jgi:hypothetical protein
MQFLVEVQQNPKAASQRLSATHSAIFGTSESGTNPEVNGNPATAPRSRAVFVVGGGAA